MPESLAEGRARWERDHGIPWSQSPAGQKVAARKIQTGVPEKEAAPSPGAPPLPKQIHAGLKAGGGGTVAGGMLGLLGFLIFRSYLTGGTKGVRAFFAAKFANRTSSQPNPAPGATAGSAPAGPPKVFIYPFGWIDQTGAYAPGAPALAPTSTAPAQVVAA